MYSYMYLYTIINQCMAIILKLYKKSMLVHVFITWMLYVKCKYVTDRAALDSRFYRYFK